MSSRASAAALSASVLVAVATAVRADTIYVDHDNCPGPGSGTAEDPFCLVQSGIEKAMEGDEIIVAPGTYGEAISMLGKAVTLRSASGPEVTVLDGTGLGQVSVVTCWSGEGPDTVIQGFTITGGTGTNTGGFNWGGGMLNIEWSAPTVIGCVFTGNSADNGGGMANVQADPHVIDCVFSGNSAEFRGGGISNFLCDPVVTGCTFIGNASRLNGGGMINFGGMSIVNDCTFIENTAGYFGGGMINFGGMSIVNGCSFNGNTAAAGGGGMLSSEAAPTLTNCVFEGNSAGDGGGLSNILSGPQLTNCTISGNVSALGGGAMRNISSDGPSLPNLDNCVIWSNGPDEVSNDPGSFATALFSNVPAGFAGIANITADPHFVDPANGDYRLAPGSPCIDAGLNDAVPAGINTDLDGNLRFADDPGTAECQQAPGACGDPPVVDMGAYEFQGVTTCPWDCGGGDGVVGIADFLALLAQWSVAGASCDFDLGAPGVGIEEFLDLLAHWGPCP